MRKWQQKEENKEKKTPEESLSKFITFVAEFLSSNINIAVIMANEICDGKVCIILNVANKVHAHTDKRRSLIRVFSFKIYWRTCYYNF